VRSPDVRKYCDTNGHAAALKYYFYLHYHEGREKGANPVGFEGPPLPVLNFITTFEYGMHLRFGLEANNDSYVK
jgi:hypothetical protein